MIRPPSARPSCTAAMPLPPAAPSTASRFTRGQVTAIDEPDPGREVGDPKPGGFGVGQPVGHRKRGRRDREALLGERAVAV